MLKETRTYTSYDGEEITQDFYFNLNKAELMELEIETPGGLSNHIRTVMNTKNAPETIKLFKKLLLAAYGVKSADGKRFIKNDQVRDEFIQTPAYSDMFMELAFDDDKAANFVRGIIPPDLAAEVSKELDTNKASEGSIMSLIK